MSRYMEVMKEAKMTAFSLLLLIIFWLLAGILGSGVEVEVYGVPLWAVLGTVGVWTFAIVLAITLSRNIKNVDL